MITRNVFVIGWLTTCIVIVLWIQGYMTELPATPIVFIVGLVGATLVAGWKSLRVDSRALVIFVIISIIIAFIDEYAHTSTEVLRYHDGGVPSFLTVLGWPLFILTIVWFAEFIENQAFKKLEDRRISILAPIIAIVLIPLFIITLESLTSSQDFGSNQPRITLSSKGSREIYLTFASICPKWYIAKVKASLFVAVTPTQQFSGKGLNLIRF